MCPGCTGEAGVNQQDTRAEMPFKTRFRLLGRCPLEPREVVPMVKYQELTQVLALSGGPSAGWPWHESGRRGGSVQGPAGVYKTTGPDLCLVSQQNAMALGLKV